MSNRKSIQLWGLHARALSRIWVCGQCGTKLFCGRLTSQPSYRCLCGKSAWRQPDEPPWAGRP